MDTGNEGLKKLFKLVLGTKINIKDNIDATEEIIFEKFIGKLEESHILEEQTFETTGIDLTKITEGLWFVIENQLRMLYG